MGSYSFTVTDLEWPSETTDLPDSAVVYLSKHLVESDQVIDIEWENAVNKQLFARYGINALGFNFEPTDLGDFECLVSDLERIEALGEFRNGDNDELLFRVADTEEGHLALECITSAIDEFDDAECEIVKTTSDGLHALIVLQGDINDLGSDIFSKWEFYNDDTDGDFYEHVDAGMVIERLRGDAFDISKIVWMSPSKHLPNTTVVHLPDWLVCAQDHKSGGEWNREINDQLQAKYGVRARSFIFGRSL